MSIHDYCRRPTRTAGPDETLRAAAQRMEKEGVGALVVTDGGRLAGILTDRDLALHVAAEGHDAETARIGQVMKHPVASVDQETGFEDAVSVLAGSRLRRLPVLDDDGSLAGLVSLDDLVRVLAFEISGLGDVLVAQLPAGGPRAEGRSARRAEHYLGRVVTAPVGESVEEVAKRMASETVGTVVAVDDAGAAVGIVTDRDLALRVVVPGLDPAATPLSAVMSAPLVSAEPTDALEEVVGRMRASGVRRVPVLRAGRPVGLVAFDDLLVGLGRELDRLGECVAGEIRATRLRRQSSRMRRELVEGVEEAVSQLRQLGGQALQGLSREFEDVVERVAGSLRRGETEARGPVRVRDLMETDVRTCTPADALADAARIMWERDCGCVPVVDADGSGRVVGMITDRDVCMAAFTNAAPLGQLRVEQAMAHPVHACRPEDGLPEAEARMRSAQVRRLPVVDEAGHLRGLLSLADLAVAAAGRRGVPAGAVTDSEIGVALESICRPRRDVAR